jgi:hypothetical protein
MHEWYYMWRFYTDRRHMSEYNMLIKHMVWINGRELDQLEEVPGAFVPDFGCRK